MTVGQLLKLTPEQRKKAIACLTPSVRMKLAHLASLGIKKKVIELAEYQNVLTSLTQDEGEK